VLKVIVANSTMIKAYKAGVPGNGQPFPDFSMIVKLQWKPKKSTEASLSWMCQTSLPRLSSSKRTARDFRKARVGIRGVQLRSCIGPVHGRSQRPLRLRARVPYGREGEGLHLPPVPERLNRACPDIKYPAQRMSLCEALFSTWTPVSAGSAANCTAGCCLKESGLARFELQSVGVPRIFSGQMTLR
jgi:hypothetical protein